MRRSTILLLVVVLVAGCQKHQEKKAWKKWYGSYSISGNQITMWDDFHGEPVYATQLGINKYGISFSTEGGTEPSCSFSKMDDCDKPGFDYQLQFDQITLFVFGSGGTGQLQSPSKEELNENRSYYLKRINDSKILFIAHMNGQEQFQAIFNLEE